MHNRICTLKLSHKCPLINFPLPQFLSYFVNDNIFLIALSNVKWFLKRLQSMLRQANPVSSNCMGPELFRSCKLTRYSLWYLPFASRSCLIRHMSEYWQNGQKCSFLFLVLCTQVKIYVCDVVSESTPGKPKSLPDRSGNRTRDLWFVVQYSTD